MNNIYRYRMVTDLENNTTNHCMKQLLHGDIHNHAAVVFLFPLFALDSCFVDLSLDPYRTPQVRVDISGAAGRLYQDILNVSRDKTTFFITHRMSSVRFADRIVVLEGGRMAEEDSFKALMEKNGRFAHLYALQKQGLV